jgi:hypothetical protein
LAAVLYVKYADAKRRLWRSAVKGAQDSTRRKRLKDVSTCFARSLLRATRIFCNGNEAPRLAPPPPRFARCASSGGPPPPLRWGGKWRRSRAALHRSPRNRFANNGMFSLCAFLYSLFPISFSQFVISSLKKLRGRSADRRHCLVTAPRKAHVAMRFTLGARARHTGRARLPALRRGSRLGERTPRLSPRPRFLGLG